MLASAGGGNVYNTSANAYNGAVGATQGAMVGNAMAQPMLGQTTTATANNANVTNGQAQGYNAFTGVGQQGYEAGNAQGGGYTAATMGPATQVSAGQFAGMDINPYMNPYQSQVIDQTAADMERQRLIAQNQADDAMTAAGAFGGSRHGIANAETNRNYYDRLGSTLGGLYNTGYQNAQNAAFQDISNQMQGDLANQQADLTTGQFNANAQNQARQTGANNSLQASLANANAQTALAGQRIGAENTARQFGANANNNMSQFNAQSANDMSRFNNGLQSDTSRFNAGARNDMSRFNAGEYNGFQQNQFNNQMAGAQQLGGFSSLGFNMGNTIADRQAADGAQARQLQQQIMDAAQRQWGDYTGTAATGLAGLQQGIASGKTSTSTAEKQGGLLDFVGPFL